MKKCVKKNEEQMKNSEEDEEKAREFVGKKLQVKSESEKMTLYL